LSEATKEAVYLNTILAVLLQLKRPGTVTMYNDNQGAQELAKNAMFSHRTKHIDIRFHFIYEAVEERKTVLRYKKTEEMSANFLTKPVPK
jgi:hypothetical protein